MYAHLDLDSFFVSVERLHDRSLIGKPVVVGGSPEGRGVVACASYEARKYGIHSAMPMREAVKRYSDLIICSGHNRNYSWYSGAVAEVLERYIPIVHQTSVDEFYLNCAGMSKIRPNLNLFLHDLRLDLIRLTGLPMSVGVGRLPYLAKMASKKAKPCGYYYLSPDEEINFLSPLSVRDLPGIGEKTEKELNRMGIRTLGEFATMDGRFVKSSMGMYGEALWKMARGEGSEQLRVAADSSQKSLSAERTFATDLDDFQSIRAELHQLVESLSFRLRQLGKMATVIETVVRYTDFTTVRKQQTVIPTCIDRTIREKAWQLLQELLKRRVRVRLIGVRLSGLQPHNHLFEFDHEARNSRLAIAIDALRKKHHNNQLLTFGMSGYLKSS